MTNVTYTYTEPYVGTSLILKLINSGKLEPVVAGLKFGAIVLGVVIAMLTMYFVLHHIIYHPEQIAWNI
jgi:hypothetical protein